MQFSKLFGVTLLAMASSAEAQTHAGYIPRTPTTAVDYWETDIFQKDFEDIMSTESCPDVDSAKDVWEDGSDPISIYLQSIPTKPSPESKEWKEYINYYGSSTFHIDWVNAAFNCGTTAGFTGPSAAFDPDFNAAYCGGDGDFTNLPTGYAVGLPNAAGTEVVATKECVGIEESVKKATSYVYQFIEVVQLLESAIKLAKNGCNLQEDTLDSGQTNCEDAMELWDGAAAVFTGSLEGPDGGLPGAFSGNPGGGTDPRTYGKTLYTLGEKRCRNFKTCGPINGDLGAPERYNTASINAKIMQFFAAGSHATYSGDYRRMEYFKRQISAKIMVPWTQGVFRYAHRLSSSTTEATSREHKEIAELSTFAVGALPKLWACSVKANDAVAPLFRTGNDFGIGNEIDYIVIKKAFECNYRCLGITCEEVGGLYDIDLVYDGSGDLVSEPKPDAEACDDKDNLSSAKEIARCVKVTSKYNKKCKLFIGKSGIGGRTLQEYYVDKLG